MAIDGIHSGASSYIQSTQSAINQSAERISSGQRINRASDDAAGQAIAERLTREISGFEQASRNINDGISLTQIADGGLETITDGLQRIRELSLQASNGTLSDNDRNTLNNEAQQLKEGIQQALENTTFNGKPVLTNGDSINIQTGTGSDDQTSIATQDIAALLEDSGFNSLDLSSADSAREGLDSIDNVQAGVDQQRAEFGAVSNRFSSAIDQLSTNEISASKSRSAIADADIAKEVSQLTQQKILQETSIALQSQANQNKKSVLNLLTQS